MRLTIEGRRIDVIVYRNEKLALRNEKLALRAAQSAEVPTWVVMGDAPEYWLVRPVDAAHLEKAGYEILVGGAR